MAWGALIIEREPTERETADHRLRPTKSKTAILCRREHILGPFGPESALRCYGLGLAAEGTARARKRATVAVARKLAVLLLSLWKSQQLYEPFPRKRSNQ